MSRAIAKLAYTHEAMIDAMIANPCVSGGELAFMFGLTEPWVSRVRSSDAFREKLRARTSEMVDPILSAEIEQRFDMLANRSLEVLMDKLSKPSDEVSADLAMQAATLGAKVKGLGGFGAKATVQVNLPDPNRIENLANRLRSLNNQGAVDVEAREVQVASLPVPSEARPV